MVSGKEQDCVITWIAEAMSGVFGAFKTIFIPGNSIYIIVVCLKAKNKSLTYGFVENILYVVCFSPF